MDAGKLRKPQQSRDSQRAAIKLKLTDWTIYYETSVLPATPFIVARGRGSVCPVPGFVLHCGPGHSLSSGVDTLVRPYSVRKQCPVRLQTYGTRHPV